MAGTSPAMTSGIERGNDGQTEKLVPQPHAAVTFGLLSLNWAPIRSSTKSSSAPCRKPSEIGIDHHPGAVALDQEIVGRRLGHQVEAILEARAAAALDADAEQRGRGFGLQELGDAARGARARW